MSRRFVTELTDGQSVNQIFLASQKQLRPNRAGNLYIQLRLCDRSGSITGMLWNANEKQFEGFVNGDFVKIEGKAQFYNGSMQIILQKISKADANDVDPADFENLSGADIDSLAGRLSEILRQMKNFHLRNLAECFLIDEEFMAQFKRAPAGIKHHHAYHGGLLEHTLAMVELAQFTAPRYTGVDEDIMMIGAFLHDVGKTRELIYERDLSYSDEGQLLGHLTIGCQILDDKIKESEKLSGEPFPDELAVVLKHIILSHHGQHEYGSPKLPMTLEAIALHYLDTLDSKLNSAIQIIEEDVNKDSHWTTYQPAIDRKLMKPR
jgi:3'-5' exoribonuclease